MAPDDLEQDRVAALAGLAFVLMDVTAGLLGGEPPSGAASAGEVAEYVHGHQTGLEAGLWLFGLASIALIWWFGSVWRRMVRDEGGAPRLAIVSLMGLVVAGALSLTASAVLAALALRADDLGTAAPLAYTLSAVLLAASGFGVATHVLATTLLGRRSGTMPSLHAGIGYVAGVAFTIAAVLGSTSTGAAGNAIGLVGFVSWMAWILGVSRQLWYRELPSQLMASA